MATKDRDDDDEERDSERPAKKRATEERKKPRRVEEPPQVIGGRFLVATVFVLVLTVLPMSAVGSIFEPKDQTIPKPNTWEVGNKATVAITLITADYNKLGCAYDKPVAGYHCGWKGEKESWPREPGAPIDDNKASVIQPYRTWLDNQLILVAGMWATPALATRLHREPTVGVDEDKLARFVVECEVTFVGKLDGVKLRWNPGQWTNPDQTPMLARPESCKLIDAEPP
jgi:hypothetical protein